MTTHDVLLPAAVLQRKAVVYVRQSTPQQVQSNLESQRRQYELVEVARRRGFTDIDVIDDAPAAPCRRTGDHLAHKPSIARCRSCPWPGFGTVVSSPCSRSAA